MAKTLNQFLEGKTAATGYLKVKSPDEQKFVDKHVRVTTAEPAGNGDEVFKASKIKTNERKQGRKGYNPGEDEAVYEETGYLETDLKKRKKNNDQAVKDMKKMGSPMKNPHFGEEAEQIDELSATTKDAYAQKAGKQLPGLFKKSSSSGDAARKYYNRKNTVRKIANEEVEALEELSTEKLLAYRKKAREADTNKHHVYADAADEKIKKKTGRYNPNIMQRAKAKLMGEEFIDLLATGEIVFANEEVRSVSEREVTLIATVLNRLSEENQDQFCEVALKSLDGFDKMLSFAIQNKGE